MSTTPSPGTHPGAFVRAAVLPAQMSVKDAAERLGIGRPALSNFLNGKAALSNEMAVRLEKTFGADRQQLLDMQAAYDRHHGRAAEKEVAVRAFVPSFLTIRARQIEAWADSCLDARSSLPVLLRKLVHSTGSDLRQVDFPGFDNAQRKGNDGFVEAGAATPWIPEGRSYWEFGTDQRPGAKAETDFKARLASVDLKERAISTFVFVTPRNWPGKTEWAKRKSEAGWKAVRALDASDLEQWLEQSVPGQIWFAEQLGLPSNGFETLEHAWSHWANASEPPLSADIFAQSIAGHRDRFKSWLEKPSERPFVIAADSGEEALAFLACLLQDDEFRAYRDLAAVFRSPATLRTLIDSSIPFIPIVLSEDVERALLDAYRRLHCVVFRPRNAVDTEADIALDLLSFEAFRNTLTAMGIAEHEVDRLSRESGRSPTILRRRLSHNAAIRTPSWAGDDATARTLMPMALIGAWHSDTEADRAILEYLANRDYAAIDVDIARLLRHDDSPVWYAGRYRGVASKIDALFAVARNITRDDIDRFMFAAKYVLSEADPALTLPESDRWAAALHGKKRDHSAALREGVCETLVILSVHGNHLFRDRLHVDLADLVSELIRNLLLPLTLERLLSNDRDLPRYAEAAPEACLQIIEDSIRQDDGVVFDLLKPVERGAWWASPSRTGLLWALEFLAWKPQHLLRVTRVLARLARPTIDDNWLNKPDASLKAIFRAWLPQTAASLEQRIRALEDLARHSPDVAWTIALDQVQSGSQTGHYSYRPRWRSDASGAGRGVTMKDYRAFCRRAIDLLIEWPTHDESRLGDLVERVSSLSEDDQERVWHLVDNWSHSASEAAKASLRERVRRCAFTRRGRHSKLGQASRNRAQEAYAKLEPKDPVVRHGWLFASHWIQESAEELHDEDLDYGKREERIDARRREAMSEMLAARGLDGVRELLSTSSAPDTVGFYAATQLAESRQRLDFILHCMSLTADLQRNADGCLQGFLRGIEDNARIDLLQAAVHELALDMRTRLLACAPFHSPTWRFVETFDEGVRTAYWKEVFPFWGKYTPVELSEVIDRLLEVKRPRAAFTAVHLDFEGVETSRLKRLLLDVATVNAEPATHFKLDSYDISEALSSLNGRAGVTANEMAQLEFLFIDALDDSEHGIPNLEAQIAESPLVFVQAVALAYKRSDSGEDPPEWRIENPEQRTAVARAAYRLLHQLSKLPGAGHDGLLNATALGAWITDVRRLCKDHARTEIGDQCLGQLLAKAPEGGDGVWPCEAVRHVMEDVASQDIAEGFYIGVKNSRGVVTRGDSGRQERELASRYRSWAERLHFEFPFVARILEGIASSYDSEAGWEDAEVKIMKRLGH